MEFWFTERQTEHLGLSFRVRASLWRERTCFQDLAILDTFQYGRMLVLDGAVQTTEADEFVYHEMITHVPLLSHPGPERVLVVGGGDGGVVREVLKHPTVERVRVAEIDERVVEVAKHFLPGMSASLTDPRVEVWIGDGVAIVEEARGEYDVILVDSTDPVGPAVKLFEISFYRAIERALRPGGLFTAQCKSPFLDLPFIQRMVGLLRGIFPVTRVYTAPVQTYPSGLWCFLVGSKGPDPLLAEERRVEPLPTRYYTSAIHRAAFVLPREVQEAIERT